MSRIAIFKLSHKTTGQEIIGSHSLGDRSLNEIFSSACFPEIVRETAANAMSFGDRIDGVDYIGSENWKVIDYSESNLPDWVEAVFVPKALNQSVQAYKMLRKISDSYLTAIIHQTVYEFWKKLDELVDIPYPKAAQFQIRSWEDTPDVGYGFVDMTFFGEDMRPINFDQIADNFVQPTMNLGHLDSSVVGELSNQRSQLAADIFEEIRDKVSAIGVYDNWDDLMDEENNFNFSEELFQKIEAGE
jgi:hypothetical protein